MKPVNLTCHTDRTEITFSGTLDVGETRSARETLDEALTRALPIELFARDLERVDTAGLQLLLVFLRCAHQRGLPSQWRNVSPVLASNAGLLGLASTLELPQ